MAEIGAIERISLKQLREVLRQGLEEVLKFIPQNDEPTIQLAYYDGQQSVPLTLDERTPLGLLCDFVSAVRVLSRGRRSVEEVQRILGEEGVAQMILSEDDFWYQIYVD